MTAVGEDGSWSVVKPKLENSSKHTLLNHYSVYFLFYCLVPYSLAAEYVLKLLVQYTVLLEWSLNLLWLCSMKLYQLKFNNEIQDILFSFFTHKYNLPQSASQLMRGGHKFTL